MALIIDDRAPDPARDAGSVALLSHIDALQSLGFSVFFAASRVPPTPVEVERLAAHAITCLAPPFFETVEHSLKHHGAALDLIYIHRLSNAASYTELVRHHAPTATLIWSIADLASRRLQGQARVENRPELARTASRVAIREHMQAWSADAVITHSPIETAALQRAVPTATIATIPWAIPARSITRAGHAAGRPPVIAFIGHFAHAPNLDAAKYIATTLFPLFRAERADLTCRLIGSAAGDTIHRLAAHGLQIAGHVPDLDQALSDVDVCIAPLRFGAGLKGKILQAWANGIPVMMSSIAAEGLFPPDNPLMQDIADDPAEFVAGTLALLDAERATAHCGHAHILLQTIYSADAVRSALRLIVPS